MDSSVPSCPDKGSLSVPVIMQCLSLHPCIRFHLNVTGIHNRARCLSFKFPSLDLICGIPGGMPCSHPWSMNIAHWQIPEAFQPLGMIPMCEPHFELLFI